MKQKNYDAAGKRRAQNMLLFRVIVCVYILYLAYQVLRGIGNPESGLTTVQAALFGGIMALAAVGLIVYFVRRYFKELQALELPEDTTEASTEDSQEDLAEDLSAAQASDNPPNPQDETPEDGYESDESPS